MLDLFPQHVATAHAYNMPLRVLAPLPGVAYSSRSPPPTLLGLLFRAVAQFSRYSIRTFNARLKIREKKEGCEPRTSDVCCLCQRIGSRNTQQSLLKFYAISVGNLL